MGQGGAATRLLTVACAAEVLNVSENTVRALCQSRKIQHHRVGLGRGAIRIEPQALEDYLRGVRVDLAAEAGTPRKTRTPAPMTPRPIDLG
jgi:excisionase family DNA binding protein